MEFPPASCILSGPELCRGQGHCFIAVASYWSSVWSNSHHHLFSGLFPHVKLTIITALLQGWDLYATIFQIGKLRPAQVESVVFKPGCASEPIRSLLIMKNLERESEVTQILT